MDSCQLIYQRTTSNIVANLISLRNSSVKRDKLAKTLESHLSNGTFPSNLNFNLAQFQFPLSTTEEEREDLNNLEAELLQQFKVDLLTNRYNLSKIISDRISKQLLEESQKSAIKKRILDEIPTLKDKNSILSELIFTIETQFGAFIAKQSHVATPAPREPGGTHEQPPSALDLESIRKELSAIRVMVENHNNLPRNNSSLNRRDPRAHRRGSVAITDGWQVREHRRNRAASPYHRERSNSDLRNQSPSARIQKNRNEQGQENHEKGSRRQPGTKHQQPGNQQGRQNSTPYRPRKN